MGRVARRRAEQDTVGGARFVVVADRPNRSARLPVGQGPDCEPRTADRELL
jgi:hypothetical protein